MIMNSAIKLSILILGLLLLNGCSLHSGRYQQAHDSHPDRLPTASELADAKPRFEAYSKQGNKSQYTVRGKQYRVMTAVEEFTQVGEASWYGKKFHGHLTSNGEIYNMYSMSAAHKNLPLPTYLKVTNLANNKEVIVRVNDRGPFHQDRIIDLSYSAAYKLDMLKTGTAKVKIEAITEFPYRPQSQLAEHKNTSEPEANKKPSGDAYIQVFATSKHQVAINTKKAIENLFQMPVKTPQNGGIYRVQVGPLTEQQDSIELLNQLKENGYPNAYLIN